MLRVYVAIVVLGVVAILARRFVKKTSAANGVTVTARATLARGVAVAVVEVDHRRFLVSVNGSATMLLAELDHAAVIADVVPAAALAASVAEPSPLEPARSKPVRPEPAFATSDTPGAQSFLARARRATSRSLQPTGR